MIKRVNFTGRKRIPRRHVVVQVHDGPPRTFEAAIELNGCGMPEDAHVYMEAMCAGSTVVKRFDFGLVREIVPPAKRTLDDLTGENVFFSLKVVDRHQRMGRILGIAENLRPENAANDPTTGRKSILPIEAAQLGQRVWDIRFTDHSACLLVNEEIPGLKERLRWDPLLYTVVYPAVIRQVLTRVIEENVDAEEESERWPVLWARFAQGLHPERMSAPRLEDSQDDRDDWLDAVVESFAQSHTLRDIFAKELLANGDQA
jgi:hypothetical protein